VLLLSVFETCDLLIRYVSENVRAMYIVQSVASFSVVLSRFCVCCAVISAFLCFLFSPFVEMVQAIQALIGIYKERLMAMPTAPNPSFGRSAFGPDGAVNRLFLMHLFLDFDTTIQFLKDIGLIRSQMSCYTCGLDITWRAIPQRRNQFRWRCRRRAATVCSASRSIKHGSWFHHSCLTFQEVLFLT